MEKLLGEVKKSPLLALLCFMLLSNSGVEFMGIMQTPATATSPQILSRLEAMQAVEAKLVSIVDRLERDQQRTESEVVAGRQLHQQGREVDAQHSEAIRNLERNIEWRRGE